ncbi:MAG TPA: hypothetical protein VKI19_04220 [Acidimicrobiales bacterium]|nr:hypothetical protein [Acidimicrobiales bacterium]
MGAVLVVLVVLALAASVKAATAANPALKVRATIAPTAVLAGPAPRPAWPATGEAAVEVEGLPPLGHSGPTTPEPIASLAKVMTAYVVLRDHPLASGHDGFSVTVGGSDVADYEQRLAQAESVVPVSLGEQLSERQLLQGLLVASGNNFATLLADFDAGSEPRFVAKMQSEAGRLGMGQTTYTDPSGLSSSTVSDAADQLVLAAQAMTVPAFAETVAMTSVTLPLAGTVANFNTAVGSGGYVGIKTGSDFTAGGCLMFANRQAVGGHQFTILGVVLGQRPGLHSTSTLIAAATGASTALVTSIRPALEVGTVVRAGQVVAEVTNPEGRRVPVTTERDVTVAGYGGTTIPLSISLEKVGTALHRGQVVALVSVAGSAPVPAVAGSAMAPVSFGWKLAHDY